MAMVSERPQTENSPCDRLMELQSRKQVIERWLATPAISAQYSSVLQEMLAAVEAELTALSNRHFTTKYLATNKRLQLDDADRDMAICRYEQ
jgi:hypothetical protein